MAVVVVCPACQKRARVPEPMLGKTVRCPACAATFLAGDGPAAVPNPEPSADVAPEDETSPVVTARPPLPAEADVLRSLRAGVYLQLLAQGLYAAALATFLLVALGSVLSSGTANTIGTTKTIRLGGPSPPGQGLATLSALASLVGLLLLGGAATLGLTGSALCTLAPAAYLTRGLAIAGLALIVLGLMQSANLIHWFALLSEGMPMLAMSGGGTAAIVVHFLMPVLWAWLLETARLTILALFWRAVCFLLRDGTGALLALRLAYAIPAVQGSLLLIGLLVGVLGGSGGEVVGYIAVIGVVVQLGLLVWGVIVAERVWRRLRAVVPPA